MVVRDCRIEGPPITKMSCCTPSTPALFLFFIFLMAFATTLFVTCFRLNYWWYWWKMWDSVYISFYVAILGSKKISHTVWAALSLKTSITKGPTHFAKNGAQNRVNINVSIIFLYAFLELLPVLEHLERWHVAYTWRGPAV